MTGLPATLLAITMIASFLLIGFGIGQVRRPEGRQRGLLMIACGIVFLANVAIWTL